MITIKLRPLEQKHAILIGQRVLTTGSILSPSQVIPEPLHPFVTDGYFLRRNNKINYIARRSDK